ncbi:hypothetical protein [Dapis sp. BLCC M126]|uniref:hypothetical protein n=1 Tax=Dapis sp. BLCC M126 TaxID=3400189 RepID=UPI003CF9E2C4
MVCQTKVASEVRNTRQSKSLGVKLIHRKNLNVNSKFIGVSSVFGINLQATYLRKIITFLITIVLISGLVSCSDRLPELPQLRPQKSETISKTKISEVSPPEIIQKLRQAIDIYQPQITIQNPQPDQIFEDNDVTLEVQVQDLNMGKSDLDLGSYIEVILDDKHYTKIYDLNESFILSDLEPGTHTLRVFACSPWDESFKNEGAYAQATFHIFTKTANNNPAPDLPLLTYNSPVGSYGEEPIMLDYYLTNAPLHSVAQADTEDEIDDWRIRVTVNGTSFITDQWQSIYLQGFHPGKNWIQLEYIDELGNPINNVYNNTVHLINYKPGLEDPLSKIIRGEISLKEALSIIDLEYIYEELEPEITPEAELEPVPVTEAITEELESEETFVEPEIETEVEPELVPVTEAITEELESEETFVEPEIEPEVESVPVTEAITEELEAEETFAEPEVEPELVPVTEAITEELESEETFVEPEIEPEVESVPVTEAITEELEAEETFAEPEVEPELVPVTEAITEELESEETFVEPEIEPTSKVEPTESEVQQILKEKIGKLRNWVQGRFKGINQVTAEQEETTLEETLNFPKESEIEDSLQENEPSNLPEIVEELPIPQSPEEIAPEENSNQTSNPEEVNNSVEDSSMSANEDAQAETTLELEEITEDKPEDVVESILPKSDDSAPEVDLEIEPENLDDSVPEVNPEIEPENTSDVVENLDDSVPEVNPEIEPENITE